MSVLSELQKGTRQRIKRIVELEGMADIMFDRYAGDNQTELTVWQKAYYAPDGKTFVYPAENIMSFLSATNTNSAPRRLLETRKYKQTALAIRSYVSVSPQIIPFLRNGKPIKLGDEGGDADKRSGAFVHRSVARLDKGIPNPKVRPVLPVPWSLVFELEMYPNDEVQEQQVAWLLVEGGHAIGFGTYRGVYGKFKVVRWDEA